MQLLREAGGMFVLQHRADCQRSNYRGCACKELERARVSGIRHTCSCGRRRITRKINVKTFFSFVQLCDICFLCLYFEHMQITTVGCFLFIAGEKTFL